MSRLPDLARDERGVILGWLGKLLIGLVLTAVVIFDAGSIVINFFTLDSKAEEIAISLSTNLQPTDTTGRGMLEEAQRLAAEAEARLVNLEFDPDTRVVKVTLRRRADTLVVGRISFIKDWARATAEGQAGTG
ncbi:MAG TPA: hypothetical protein VG408_07835 [Actinomycetota bacterium]|nr:hypothetical protein [Actinomycetota bacterium]